MNLVDSCGWLEFFGDGPNASFFAKPLQKTDELIVPTVCLYEVFKKVLQEKGEDSALQAIAIMRQGKVIPLDSTTALSAAKVSHEKKIPLADSIIIATANRHLATIWTQDDHFSTFDNVQYLKKR